MDLLLWYNGVAADLRVSGRDLLADDSLYTAVVISLFTDARARAEDELPPELDGEDRRGYWGDGLEGESVGSRLWLLAREKDTARVRARAGCGRDGGPPARRRLSAGGAGDLS